MKYLDQLIAWKKENKSVYLTLVSLTWLSGLVLGLVIAFFIGVYVVDDTFSKKERYLAWDYEYFQELEAQKRCLYYWYPDEDENGSWGKRMFCLPKEYPLHTTP